ncbi:MAG: serine hydrolase domain-containing protein [Candidatus Kapaibacterium sp.]
MKKLIFPHVILILLSLLLFSCESTVVNTSNPNYDKVYRVVDSIRQSLQTSSGKTIHSLNLLINTPSEEIFVSSVPAGSTPITKNTYFRFASNTKNMTAAAILNMQEDGWLSIYDNIIDMIPGSALSYVPDSPSWDFPYKNQITIEQLLQHSAGVYDLANDSVPGTGGMSYVDYVESLDPNHQFMVGEFANQLRVNNLSSFPPGTNHSYSNTGFAILSEIIARVYTVRKATAKVYSDYLYDYLFGFSSPVPLPVTLPYLAFDQYLASPFVSGTEYLQNGGTKTFTNCNMSANVGEGNGYGTMSNLNIYIRSLMTGVNVLTSASLNLMKTDISPGSTNYALGCALIPNLGYGHTGSTHGYISAMFYDPLTGVSVICMIPVWDFSNGMTSYTNVNTAMFMACYSARSALGYPGLP